MSQSPSIGRIVHVFRHPDPRPMAGIITDVIWEEVVHLTMFDANEQLPVSLLSVHFGPNPDRRFHWEWPPFVPSKDQAKREISACLKLNTDEAMVKVDELSAAVERARIAEAQLQIEMKARNKAEQARERLFAQQHSVFTAADMEGIAKILPTPSDAMLKAPLFEIVWQVIKGWDIGVPEAYEGHCGALGNHAAAIVDAIHAVVVKTKPVLAAYDTGYQVELSTHVGDADDSWRSLDLAFVGPDGARTVRRFINDGIRAPRAEAA